MQDQRRSDQHGRAFDADRRIVAGPVLEPQAVEEVDGRAEAEAERDGQRDDAGELQALARAASSSAPAAKTGKMAGMIAGEHHRAASGRRAR